MTKKSIKIARWVSLTVLMATSARVIYSVCKYKKSQEKLSAVMPRVCSLCGKDHFLQNLERLQDGPFCKQLYTPLATSDDVRCENEFALNTLLAEMPEMNDKVCSSCEHANKKFAKKSISTSKTVKKELNWSERLLWLMFPHWYTPVAISHNQVSLQRVNHNRQNESNKSNLAVSNVKEDSVSNSEMKEFDKELIDVKCNGNTNNINHNRLESTKKLESQAAKICVADNTDAEAVRNSATITKFAEAFQTLLPLPGRRPTVAVIECPLHADIKIDAELLWEALQSDESVYVDGLIDVVIIETDSTSNLANELNLHDKFHDNNCEAVHDNDDDDDLLRKIVNAKTEAVTTATTVTGAMSESKPTSVEKEIKFNETSQVKEERKRPSLNVNDIINDTMELKKTTPEFLRFSLCDAYSFYTTLYAASFLQLYDDEVVSELNSFCDDASRRGSIHSKGEGQFVSVTQECSAQSFSVSFLPSNHWNEPPETSTSPVQRLVKAISEFPHASPLRSPSKLLQPPNKMFSRVELEHYNIINNNNNNNNSNHYTDSALGTYCLNTANICVKRDSTGKHENYIDGSQIKYHNVYDEVYHPHCTDNNHEGSNHLSELNSGNEQLKKCISDTSENKNGVSELDIIDSKCVKDQVEKEEIPQHMPKMESCHYTVHESTTYHIYVLHQGRSSQVATAALEELLANMRHELHEANLFGQVAANIQKESNVGGNNNNNEAKQSSPYMYYSHGNNKFDFLTVCTQEELTELENGQEPEVQESHELYKHEHKIDKDKEEITYNGFYTKNNNHNGNDISSKINNIICTPNTSNANLHATNSALCTTENCAKMRQLREQLYYHSQLRTNIIEHLRSHHLTRLVEIELPDMRVYRQTPPCIPRATAAFARGFNIYKTFALEMFMREREWREQQTVIACTTDSDNTSNTLTQKTVISSDNNSTIITDSRCQISKNTQNDSSDKYLQMENYTEVQSRSEKEQYNKNVLEHEPNAMQQFCTEHVQGESFSNEENTSSNQHHLVKRTNNLFDNWWRKIYCFASSTSVITELFASSNLLISTSSAAEAGNNKIKLYAERTTKKKYDNEECEEWEEEQKEKEHYIKNADIDHENSSCNTKYVLRSSTEYNNAKTDNVSCAYKCMNKDYTEHVHVQADEHDEINVPSIEPQTNCTNSHKHISSNNNISNNNCYSMANRTSVYINTHNRTHTYSYHTRCSEKQQTHAEHGQLKMTTSHYSILQTPLNTSSSLTSSGNTLANYDAFHESNTRADQTTVRPHIIKGEHTMEESNTTTQNMGKEPTRLPCCVETVDDNKPETLESSETVRTMCTMDGNENVTEYLSSSYRDARQLTWVPSREHAAIFYTLGDVNAALFDAARQPLTEQDEWYLQPSGQSLSSSTITNASSLQEAMSSHHSSASLQYVINKQNEALQKDINGSRETEHVYKSDGVSCNHMTSELWYTMNTNMNVSTTFPNNNIHHISSGSNKTNSNSNNHFTKNNNNNNHSNNNNNVNSNSSGFLEYWSQKLPWVPWSETSSIGKLQEQVEQTNIRDDDKEKMHQSYEYDSFHKNNPLNVESPTSDNVNDEYERWVEHCQCISYNRNVHFYTLFWHLHRMFYERITKLQRQYAELNYTANNNNEHNIISHKPEPLWSPLEINGSNQPTNNKVANVCVESMNASGDFNEHSCNVHNSTGVTVNDKYANTTTISKTSVRLWIVAKLTSAHHLLVHRLPRWCHTKSLTLNHKRDTHMCSRKHADDINIRESANNAATTNTQSPDNDNNHNSKKKNTNNNKKNNVHTSELRITSTNHATCDNNCDHHHSECDNDGKEELKETKCKCDYHDNNIDEDDDVIIDFNGHRRKRVDLPTNNGQYGLTPFEVWLATRYSTKIAAEVYLMDVLASKGDHFYCMSTVLDEILYHAILFYHNGNLRDFVDDLLTNFNLEYIPHTKWGEEVLTSSTIPSRNTEEHEGSCPSSELQQGNHISPVTEEHRRCCQTYKPFAPEQQEEWERLQRSQEKNELELSEQLPHEHLTQVNGNVEYKSNNNLRAAVTEKNRCASDNHSGSASRSSSLSSRTSQYCSKTSCERCRQSLTLMVDDDNDKANIFSSTTNDEEHERKERSHDTCTSNANESIVHSPKINICRETVTAAAGEVAVEALTLCEDTKIDEIITLYDVAVKMLEQQRSMSNSSSSGKCNVQRNWNTQSSVSSTALYCNLSESCSLRQAKIDELEALRLLECEMKYLKEFIMNNRNSLLSATLTAQGANKLEGVFGVPATVFPFVLCARESISVVHNVFLGMNKCYGTLRFSSFTTFIRDVFSRDRPEVIRHAPRIFRTLNKSRRGYINFEELCGWFARKLSCGNNIRPNTHFIATCMTLRLLLLLLLDQKPLWPYLECTVESLSDGET